MLIPICIGNGTLRAVGLTLVISRRPILHFLSSEEFHFKSARFPSTAVKTLETERYQLSCPRSLAMSSKPSIVFVHGAYHQPAHYKPLLSILESAGYPVTAPHLPSTQPIPAIQSIDPDIEIVRAAITEQLDAGHDVILVTHSYGGVCGSQALQGLVKADRTAAGKTTGVTAMVGIAAILIEEGEAVGDFHLVDKESEEALIGRAMKDADGYLRATPEEGTKFWYNQQKPEVAAEAAKHLLPWAMAVTGSKSVYAGWRHCPTTYIFPTKDQSLLPDFFERIVTKKNEDGTPTLDVITLEGGDHSPFLDRPEWVAKVIRKAAGEQGIEV